jgi:hypothetical protein
MTHSSHTPRKEQQLLRNARREGLLIMVVWVVSMIWTVAYCWFRGYGRNPDTIQPILGMPDWVFWGVVAPWAICLLFSIWFCFFYMAEDDLGRDPDEGADHA